MNRIIPYNATTVGRSSSTALHGATLRAVHQLIDEPTVLNDPLAIKILGQTGEGELRDDPFKYDDPLSRSIRAATVVRSRLAEDELALGVAAGVSQYVLLGAGLDTFAYRNPYAETVHVYEVDHPTMQQWKRELLQQAAIALPANLTYVPLDFEKGTLEGALKQAGLRLDVPTCFSWLGVTMYLTEAAIMDVLGFVAKMPPESSITFDFRRLPSLESPAVRRIMEDMAKHLAAIGEPWLSAFDPALLRAQLIELGFHDVSIFSSEELNQRYLSNRKDGLRANARLVCARV